MLVRILHLPHRLNLARLAEGDNHSLVTEIQQTLIKMGLYDGAAHGAFDAKTTESVLRFQEQHRLAPTGAVDGATYCRLQAALQYQIEPIEKPRVAQSLSRPNILISKSVRQLTLFDGNHPLRQFPIAIGKPATPTPEGNYAVATKIMNPGGVLGSRWMGLNYDAYGIHGTNRPWLIGQMVSNGCIRMHNPNAEELFHLIAVGTPVFIRN